MRHGIAEEFSSTGLDKDRKLTDIGIEIVKRQAQFLKRNEIDFDLIISSPYPRALQTAEIVFQDQPGKPQLRVDERLACGFSFADFQKIFRDLPHVRSVLFVGHNPDMPIIVSTLTGGSNIHFKKGTLAKVTCSSSEQGNGILEFILPAVYMSK